MNELTIERVNIIDYRMPLKRPYGTSRGITRASKNFLVRIYGSSEDREHIGVGESQPRHRLTGDISVDHAWEFLKIAANQLVGRVVPRTDNQVALNAIRKIMADMESLARVQSEDRNRDKPFRGTLLGIEIALLDFVSRAMQLPLSKLLGQERDKIEVTVSTLSTQNSAEQFRKRIERQTRYPMIRVKGIGNVDKDAELLSLVHSVNKASGNPKPIWMDLNEGLEETEAIDFIDHIAETMKNDLLPGLVTLEQPIPGNDKAGLCSLQRVADDATSRHGVGEIRIMADESLWDGDDLHDLNSAGGCRALNIKTAKAGGILSSLDLANQAVAHDPNIRLCIGGMVGTSDITTWSLISLAKSLPRLDYITATPPGNVKQRISIPLTRFERNTNTAHRDSTEHGIGAVLNYTALQPYIYQQQWYSRSVGETDGSTGNVSRTSDASGSIGLLSEAAFRYSLESSRLEAVLREHMKPKYWKHDPMNRSRYTQEAVDGISPLVVPYMPLRRMERRNVSLTRALSFQGKISEASEARQIGLRNPAWLLDDKIAAYKFIDSLNIPRPASDHRIYQFSEIEEQYPCVIKSTRSTGSRGCYLALSPNRIVHVYDNLEFSSWSKLNKHAAQLMDPKTPGHTLANKWFVEDLVVRNSAPANDVKFFSFYGDIVLILEMRRQGKIEYCFYNPDNSIPETGLQRTFFEGEGVTEADLELVRRISSEIPYPFVRIDMLRSDNGLVFGEFTPRIGGYDEFDPVWDRKLGESWARAESRLLDDHLSGKSFEAFTAATKPNSNLNESVTRHQLPHSDSSGEDESYDDCGSVQSTNAGPTLAEISLLLDGTWFGSYDSGSRVTDATFRLDRVHQDALIYIMDDETWSSKRRRLGRQNGLTPLKVTEVAASKGAMVAVSKSQIAGSPIPVLVVDNVREALFKLARFARARYSHPVVGITGTVGKSSTTRLLSSVLAHENAVHSPDGNWNTVDGVADTLGGLMTGPDVAVVEAAISGFVRVPEHSVDRMINPDVAIVTAIGEAHRDIAPTLKDTAEIKGKLVAGVRQGGSVVLTADTPYLSYFKELAREAGARDILTFGRDSQADLQLLDWGVLDKGMTVEARVFDKRIQFDMSSANEGLALNSLAVFASAHLLGLSHSHILQGLASFTAIDHVSDIQKIPVSGGECVVIDDSTNATLMSMKSAFELLARIKNSRGGRSVVALGQINYLGDATEELQASLAQPLMDSGVDLVLTTGSGMDGLRRALGPTHCGPHADSAESMLSNIRQTLKPDDILLVKGSNVGTGFRKIARNLLE